MLDAIRDMMRETDVLSLQNFGKFESKYRAPYTMRSNLPDKQGEIKSIPGAYKVKFIAFPKFNDAAGEYYTENKKKKGKTPSD